VIVKGRCHICYPQQGELRVVQYCNLCGHWMCEECRSAWGKRAWAAAAEKLLGPTANCCGPEAREA
jgi:hypothetical protein